MQETQEMHVWSDWEHPLGEGMASHSIILAWRIPWTEESGDYNSIVLQRARHDWSNLVWLYYILKSILTSGLWKPIPQLGILPVIVESLSHVRVFATPWTAARQASLSITNSWSLLKFMSIDSVMPSSQLILYHPLLLPPSTFPSIRVFSNELALHIRWPKYWNFSISPSNEHPGLISFRMD